jgi:cobalt-zinc-cadmium efflux system outer membrane protein
VSLVPFAVIALLTAADVTIEFRQGAPMALQTFDVLIFLLATGSSVGPKAGLLLTAGPPDRYRRRCMTRGWPVVLVVLLLSRIVLADQTPVESTGDLTIDRAIALATSRSLTLEAARRARAIRDAAITVAGQRPNPDLTFETTRDTPHQTIGVDWPLEIGGRRARRLDLAKEERTLADVDVTRAERAVRRQTRETFYRLVAAEEAVTIAQGARALAARLRDVTEQQFEAGAVPRLEVMQAELALARADADSQQAGADRVAARAALAAVLNLPPQQALAVKGGLLDRVAAPSLADAVAAAVTANADLQLADRDMAVEQRRLDLLKAERVPAPVVSAGAVLNAPGEFNAGPRAGVSVGLPIFTRNQGEMAASVATLAQLRAGREATARTVENAVFGLLARIDAQRGRTTVYGTQLVPTATAIESLAEDSYRSGRTSVLSVFEAQRSVRDVQREALAAALELQDLLAELEELIGTPLP